MSGSIVPVKVLRNRGIPVQVHALVQSDDGSWERAYNGDSPAMDTQHVQFTNAVLADIEDADLGWAPRGGRSEEDRIAAARAVAEGKAPPPPKSALAYWQDDLQSSPYRAAAKTLALAWGWLTMRDGREVPDVRRAGTAMVDGQIDVYAQAVSCAFMLANGIDPERVGEVLATSARTAEVAKRRMSEAVLKQIEASRREADEAEAAERRSSEDDGSNSESADSEEPTAPTRTSQSDLADDLAARKPAAAKQVARSTATPGKSASRRGRASGGTSTSSGD